MAYIPRFPDIHFDYGAIKELAPELAARGVDRPLIITDQGLVEHGVLHPFKVAGIIDMTHEINVVRVDAYGIAMGNPVTHKALNTIFA